MANRTVAFYLPQFHAIPENDEWWGRGFTEWTNVRAAKPLFGGHDQPREPGELGYYDLNSDEVRAKQAELARGAGIAGFCYYHYWFHGTQLLEMPLQRMLATGTPDFPFMLCWANEHWSRLWNGGDQELLIEQHYSDEDDLAHIRALLPTLSDPRYLRVDGAAVLSIYHVDRMPWPERTAEVWRREAAREGVDLHLCSLETTDEILERVPDGFDAAIQFLPQRRYLGSRLGLRRGEVRLRRWFHLDNAYTRNRIFSYDGLVNIALEDPEPSYLRYPCVLPGWDNSPRRSMGEARIIVGATPEAYEEWLYQVLRRFEPPAPEHDLVFVNAWNEWAESAYLEPDQRYGRAFLDAHRSAVDRAEAAGR
jgi:hypothetical protein